MTSSDKLKRSSRNFGGVIPAVCVTVRDFVIQDEVG